MRRRWILFVAPPMFLLFIAIGGLVVRELWNVLLPTLFGLPEITFWQALGVLLLSRILFGGFGLHGSRRSSMRGRVADRLADRMGDRWDAMTPEQRELFRQRLRERCGFDPSTSASTEQSRAADEHRRPSP